MVARHARADVAPEQTRRAPELPVQEVGGEVLLEPREQGGLG